MSLPDFFLTLGLFSLALMYASIFGNLTVVIQGLYVKSSRQHEDLRLTREFARFFKIPRHLQQNLESHVLHENVSMKFYAISRVSFIARSPCRSTFRRLSVHSYLKTLYKSTGFLTFLTCHFRFTGVKPVPRKPTNRHLSSYPSRSV